MTSKKFDSFVINGDAGAYSSAHEMFESFLESRAQFHTLPTHLKSSPNTVKLSLFREIHAKKLNSSLFRQMGATNQALVNYWLSRVRNLADLSFSLNDLPEFSGLTKEDLAELSKNTTDPKFIVNIESYLAKKGIIFVVEPSVDGLKTDGAVFKLSSGHPVVAMSLRHKRLDNFWFTLMHELAHVVLHYDKLDGCIIDDLDSESSDIIELEADKLAGNSLIPRNIWRTCAARRDLQDSTAIEFARMHGMHPAIVAGRIQKEINDYMKFSAITNSVDTRELLLSE
ncbi:ImmA/IrrE family metallo-endopeptidase [Neptunomonas sp.]|uniref:ImmA/IrrE family metallo-endopeptidase n=1 Tax=Neptunomonas sp. TaxID=1971898 RepID=UPI0025F02F47|nr:ImmA/IrrE family metallo-endopeptidase [Neptunomonas sp.]